MQSIADANESQNLVELVSAFDDLSLSTLHRKSKDYIEAFFPPIDIIDKFKRFYEKISNSVEVEQQHFKANIPITTLSIIDKSCQPYF